MLLTRLEEESQVIFIGDPSQRDLGIPKKSGLYLASKTLGHVKRVAVQHFGNEDIVRSALVCRIVQAYDSEEQNAEKEQLRNDGCRSASSQKTSTQSRKDKTCG